MALRVSENHLLFRIPVNVPADADRLLFFHGLQAFGVVGPHLRISQRPMLTRQACYPFPDLPKALYLFVPMDLFESLSGEEQKAFLFQNADAYLFAWNWNHPESRLTARGQSPSYEPEREGRYWQCDGGHAWVHDPFHCNVEEKAAGESWSATAEEVASGRTFLDQDFNAYEQAVASLLNCWVIADERFEMLPENDPLNDSKPVRKRRHEGPAESESYLVPKGDGMTEEALPQVAEWLLSRIPDDHPLFQRTTFRDDTYYFEPIQTNSLFMLHRDVFQLEEHLMHLGHLAEREGIESALGDERFLNFFVQPAGLDAPLPYEVVNTNKLYPELPMAYFLAGLDGERPHAQALGFYQVLEFAHTRDDEARSLQELIERIPDGVLLQSYRTAVHAEEGDVLGDIVTRKGKLDRTAIAHIVEEEMRHPTVHAGKARPSQNEAIHPFAMHQFEPRFRQITRLARELARYVVAQSGTYVEA